MRVKKHLIMATREMINCCKDSDRPSLAALQTVKPGYISLSLADLGEFWDNCIDAEGDGVATKDILSSVESLTIMVMPKPNTPYIKKTKSEGWLAQYIDNGHSGRLRIYRGDRKSALQYLADVAIMYAEDQEW